jgi:Eukaryotic protein of unknown function (DUF842)
MQQSVPSPAPALQRRVEAAQASLQQKAEQSVADVEIDRFGPLRRAMFRCGLRCYDEKLERTRTSEEKQRCYQMCTEPLQRAEMIMQNELQRVQARVQGSQQLCQTAAEDSARGASSGEMQGIVDTFARCQATALEDFLPEFQRAHERILKQVPNPEN